MKRIVTAVTATLLITAYSASPVHAATVVASCFRWATQTPYATQPVHLMQWNGQKWDSIRQGRTNASGCGTFTNTPPNAYLLLQAHFVAGNSNIGYAIYSGFTANYASPGAGRQNLTGGNVVLAQCIQGLYDYCAGQYRIVQ